MYFANAKTGYAVGKLGTILKTTDGGNKWIKQMNKEDGNLEAVYCSDVNTCFIVGTGGVILKSTSTTATQIKPAKK